MEKLPIVPQMCVWLFCTYFAVVAVHPHPSIQDLIKIQAFGGSISLVSFQLEQCLLLFFPYALDSLKESGPFLWQNVPHSGYGWFSPCNEIQVKCFWQCFHSVPVPFSLCHSRKHMTSQSGPQWGTTFDHLVWQISPLQDIFPLS